MADLEGVELSVVGYGDKDYPDRLVIQTHVNGSVEFVSGFCLEILETLQFTLKFQYRGLRGTSWWGLLRNGTWLGMSGQIQRGEADICISQSSVIMMLPALQVVSYLIPTSTQKLKAYFRQPEIDHDMLFSAFSVQVWIALGLAWGSFALALVLIRMCSRRLILTERFRETVLWLWCISTICCKGWHSHPQTLGVRMLVISGLLFAYIVNIYFSASITSSLATETVSIKTFSDLEKSNLLISGDKRLPLVRQLVEEVYKARHSKNLYDNQESVRNSYFINANESLALALTNQAAYIIFEDAARNVAYRLGYTDSYFCDEISSKFVDKVGRIPTAMFVKKGSPLKEIFNRKIVMLLERGIAFKWEKTYETRTLIKCDNVQGKYRGGLGFSDTIAAYSVWVVSILLTLLLLVLEIMCIKIFPKQ